MGQPFGCIEQFAVRNARSFPFGTVTYGKNHPSVCICVGLWLIQAISPKTFPGQALSHE
jgi:hypothetical protein